MRCCICLYARFFTKALRDIGLTQIDEPFTNLLTQGMVSKETYRCPEHGWLFPGELIGSEKDGWKCPHCGRPVDKGRVEKMSKSKKNIIDPEDLVNLYGADTARLVHALCCAAGKGSGVERPGRGRRISFSLPAVALGLSAAGDLVEPLQTTACPVS